MTKKVQFRDSIRAWMDIFMHRSMRGWWRFARSTGLSMPQFSMMMQMYHRGGFAMSEVSDRFEITPAAASQLVDKLVQSGLIERVEDSNDRRAKRLSLTGKGRELIEQGIEERYHWVDELSTRLTADELVKISEALDIMARVAQDLEAEPVH